MATEDGAAGGLLRRFLLPAPLGPRRMGLGLAALGRPGYINLDREAHLGADGAEERGGEAAGCRSESAMRQRSEEVLDAAWAAGVRWFDVARSYGLSENFLGTWLRKRQIAPHDVCVTSKWGYRYTADWRVDTGGAPHEVKDHSATHLVSQVPETVAACGEFVRLYQIHSATFESGVLENAEVHAELSRLRQERGWRLGLSLSGARQAEVLNAALAIRDPLAAGGEAAPRLFDTVQATFNVLEQAAGDALLCAHRSGLEVIVKEAVANGRALHCQALRDAAASRGTSVDCLALACVLAQPFDPFVLSGAATVAHLDSNLRADALAQELRADQEGLASLMSACRQDSEQYWKDRAALAWN